MRFLQLLTTWSNAELGLLKVCLICFGISAGIYFYDYVKPWFGHFFIVFVITAIWALLLWIKKLKQPQ